MECRNWWGLSWRCCRFLCWRPACGLLWLSATCVASATGYSHDRYLVDYLVIPLLMFWLGSIPVGVSTWLLWRQASAAAIPALLFSLVPSLGMVGVLAVFSLPSEGGCLMLCPPPPHEVRKISYVLAGLLAAFSLPVWVHLGVLHLVDARRRYRAYAYDRWIRKKPCLVRC